jgi:phage host-nuclease inhibitor protein Gam
MKQDFQVPASEQQAIELLSILSEIKEYEKQIKDAQKLVKEKYKDVEKKLQVYYESQLALDEDYKLDCDFGKLSKSNRTKWKYEDEKSIINQLETLAPELIRVKREIDKNALKKRVEVTDDGTVLMETDNGIEIIDSVIAPKEESISIKTK